jgi:hypothetical protein
MSSPAGPPPLLGHARRCLEKGRLGDGRSESSLGLHLALIDWESGARVWEDGFPAASLAAQ